MQWLVDNGVTSPQEITARHVRAYLSELAARGCQDSTVNNRARAIRTLLRFFHAEQYIPVAVIFKVPPIVEKRLPCLTAEEVKKLIAACRTPRDKAVVLLMVDTGLRRAEFCALNWEDVDISSGLVRVVRGKGGKARSVVVGVATRRALLAYRRTVSAEPAKPLFQTDEGEMNVLHLQGLMGHSTIEMTRCYVQMLDDNLVEAHGEHGPIDHFLQISGKR